jgi:3',5'-cyclic-AMP phosphodiesterase
MKKHLTLPGALLCMALLAISCKGVFQYHPQELRLEEAYRNLNAKNMARIAAIPQKDSLRFILIGDTQRFYDEVEDFVAHINMRNDIDFAVLAGDIADFGTAAEMKWVHDRLSKMKIPYIAVIGNHDMLGNGRAAFAEMYGPENFTFACNGTKFLCLNTNSNEVGFDGSIPNMNFLHTALSDLDKYDNAFVVAHMPPYDGAFDSTKEEAFVGAVRASGKVRMSLHGHQHKFSMSEYYNDGIPYVVVGSFNKRNYAVITASTEGAARVEEKYY